jgi:cytochrome P450
MLLERYVPDTGLTLPNGSFIPPGTSVGINPYVIGRNKHIWGEDADSYRPERWLQSDGETEVAYKDRMHLFNASDLTFGGGSRVCIGRNLAQLEIYKIVATLVRRYRISLVDPNVPWVVTGSWFLRQKGLQCYLEKRG